VSDVTAIWNTNAFFAYLITVKLFQLKWESKRLAAVSLATLGVIAVVYGGTVDPPTHVTSPELKSASVVSPKRPPAPLIGNLLTLIASFGYGLYQVLYKKYAALPSDPDELIAGDDVYTPLPNSEDPIDGAPIDAGDAVSPPPFGLHSNLLTSFIGVCTLLLLWIPIPLLHWAGIEPFTLPKSMWTVLAIAGIALSGVLFNSGMMVIFVGTCSDLPI
jgi:drug/metabolite transporter (DMT)-like permease